MTKKDQILYVRNARPNTVVFPFDGVRYKLEHRGNRADSTALPPGARQDALIERWLKNGQLEEISHSSFMQLGKRSLDTLPNEFLKRDLRNSKNTDLRLVENKDETSKQKIDIVPADATKKAGEVSRPEWAGEIMTTEEELETLQYDDPATHYPSKNR
jgi:hypothetical protein